MLSSSSVCLASQFMLWTHCLNLTNLCVVGQLIEVPRTPEATHGSSTGEDLCALGEA